MGIDIAGQVCEAIDQIVNERLKSINYDTTIIATIIDNKDAKKNKYTCSNGTSSFIAYSKETNYKLNDSVLVTIPNNDYTQQKTIIAKYVAKTAEPFIFTQPFDTIVDVTANIFGNGSYNDSLLANEDYDKHTGRYTVEKLLAGTVFKEAHSSFTRLGVQGQFQTCLNSLNVAFGNYGYRIEILSDNDNTITSSTIVKQWVAIYYQLTLGQPQTITDVCEITPDDWFTKFNAKIENDLKETLNGKTLTKDVFQEVFGQNGTTIEQQKKLVYGLLSSNIQITEVYLDSSDMFGNPYKFQTYFEQEKVYDVSALKNIYGINLYFYQISNTFFDEDNNPIPYKTDDPFALANDGSSKLMNNLWTKDPYVCLGYDIKAFNSEEAILYTSDSDTFIIQDGISQELNKKNIRLRWLHEYEDGQIKVIDESSDIGDYEIRWYRFKIGASSADEYSGVYWERVNPSPESIFSYTLQPAVNVASEEIKAIVLYDNQVIRSNILKFTNEKETASGATAQVVAGLSLWCKDNSYGNYFIYGQNNNALESNLDSKRTDYIRDLEAKFADESLLAEEYNIDREAPTLTEATEIIWEFPLKNTMLIVDGFDYSFKYEKTETDADGNPDYKLMEENDKANNTNRFKKNGYLADADVQVRGNTIYIKRYGSIPGNIIEPVQKYLIKKTYNSTAINNTVRCSIKKNSLMYSTQKEFSFGLVGTTGTDATVVIDFQNNKTALTADWNSESLTAEVHLYNSSYEDVIYNKGLNIKCEWSWYAYHEFTETAELQLLQNALNTLEQNDPAAFNALTDEDKRQIRIREVNTNATIKLRGPSEDEAYNICHIEHNKKIPIDSEDRNYFLILQVKITGYGDYDLIAYKPVPIRATNQYRNIIGPTEIIYNSTGEVDYYKEPIELWWCRDPKSINQYDHVEDQTTISNFITHWEIYNPYQEPNYLIGSVSQNNILQPASLYIKNTEPYGIVCYDNANAANKKKLWIQPIMVLQNKYPSSTLNKWDGKSVELNKDEGYIVAPAIAAGKKNSSDNTFSGVMIGDWSKLDTASDIAKQTGVYGFHHGAVSFAFKEDGTGFIGKSGNGRILLDGDKGTIQSALWPSQEAGMFMDLDDAILKLQKNDTYEVVNINEEQYNNATEPYYIFESNYIPVEYREYGSLIADTYDSSQSYYLFQLTDVEGMTKEEFDEKKINNTTNRTLYRKNIEYEEITKYNAALTEYYIDTFLRVSITEADYNNAYGIDGYYVLNASGEYEKSTSGYVPTESYYIGSVKAKKYFVSESDFNNYLSQGKIYKMKSYNYFIINEADSFDYSYIYAEYKYNRQTYPASGPTEDSQWNLERYDPKLHDQYKYSYETGHYYIYKEGFFEDTSGRFVANQTYYKNNPNDERKYITLSAKENKTPLSIGTDSSVAKRNFRVDWDGTAHIKDGDFDGDVIAQTLKCDKGTIGGWVISKNALTSKNDNIVLNSEEGSIEGGILKTPDGGMELQGFLTVRDANGRGEGTYMGYMQMDSQDEAENASSDGIGMRIDKGSIGSQIKATSKNAGLSYTDGTNGGWLSMHSGGFSLGHSKNATITGDVAALLSSGVKTAISVHYLETGTDSNGSWAKLEYKHGIEITLGTDKSGAKAPVVTCNAIPENQHGIYARFA